jgi:Flp pilus assembly protein TadG
MQPGLLGFKGAKRRLVAGMKDPKKSRFRLASREDGVISVELVILFPVIALIVLGILEFGHLWQVRHVLTIASREGARAAVVFQPGGDSAREAWATNTAKTAVTSYMQNAANWKVGDYTIPDPTVTYGPSGTLTGGTLTVQVKTNNSLLVLHKMIKNITIVAQTTMRFE